MKATVITDASFCPDTASAGWAAWVAYDKGKIKQYGAFKRKPKDSAQAELWAAINGIAIASKAGAKKILLQTDCQQVVDLINREKDKVYQALALAKITDKPTIDAIHVKGHTNKSGARFWVNRWCDEKAGIVMREQRAATKK